MKIALITTLPSLIENKRIEQEVKALRHDFQLINLKNFSFTIKNNQLSVDNLDALNADLVILRGIFNSMKPIAHLVENIRKRGIKVFDNNFINSKYSINKIYDLVRLSLKDIPVPNTVYLRNFDQFESAAQKLGFPVIIKSTRMGKGVNVFKVNNQKETKALVQKLENEDKKANSYILQEFIDYQYDLRCLIIGSNVYTMRRIPGEGEFRANFSLGGDVELFDLDANDQALAKRALHAIDMTVGGVDILIDKNEKRYILEVNHTAGMVGMEKATGENITSIYVKHALKHAI